MIKPDNFICIPAILLPVHGHTRPVRSVKSFLIIINVNFTPVVRIIIMDDSILRFLVIPFSIVVPHIIFYQITCLSLSGILILSIVTENHPYLTHIIYSMGIPVTFFMFHLYSRPGCALIIIHITIDKRSFPYRDRFSLTGI